MIFESKVSALFWAVYLEEASVEAMSGLLPSAQYLYEELMLTPYMARIVVLHKPHSPHAWCDSLRSSSFNKTPFLRLHLRSPLRPPFRYKTPYYDHLLRLGS